MGKRWIFTPRRKASLRKAQKVHAELVELGKRVRAQRRRG